MTSEAPERIWFNGGLIDIHMYTSLREFAGGIEYVRADARPVPADRDELERRADEEAEASRMRTEVLDPPQKVDRGAIMDLMSNSLGAGEHLDLGGAADAILEYLSPAPEHSDDQAVDRFAAAMKSKLAEARAKGRSGWDDPDQCSIEFLVSLLIGHIGKGNPGNFEDIANLCMMLHQRGADPAALSPAPVSGWRDMESAPKDGRAVLLWWPHWWHDPHPGYYLHNRWHSDKALSGGTDDDPNGPTHWMPLPAAPTSEPATEQDAVREAAWQEPTVVYNWNTASWEIRKRLHQRFTCRDDALRALIEREEG